MPRVATQNPMAAPVLGRWRPENGLPHERASIARLIFNKLATTDYNREGGLNMPNTFLTQEQLRQEIARVIEVVERKELALQLLDSAKMVSHPFSGNLEDMKGLLLEPKSPWRPE